MSVVDRKLELIERLLAKAESTSPEEAEALTEHAERLMIKYGIEQARLDERRGRAGDGIVECRRLFTGVYRLDERQIGIAVAFGLGTVRPLQASIRGAGVVLYFVGFESDVRLADRLLDSLLLQARVALREWWLGHEALYRFDSQYERQRARAGFLRGFAWGVRDRLAASRVAVVAEAGSGTDLVLASRIARVDAAIGDVPAARGRLGRTDATAGAAGRRAGTAAHLGTDAAIAAERSMTR